MAGTPTQQPNLVQDGAVVNHPLGRPAEVIVTESTGSQEGPQIGARKTVPPVRTRRVPGKAR
ncbi:hypothetical protein Pve01_00200 [Planomonospora venezuelensis]|nr:hypothetical protein Pve01_00200 [Planomonospora venezuelensis]